MMSDDDGNGANLDYAAGAERGCYVRHNNNEHNDDEYDYDEKHDDGNSANFN